MSKLLITAISALLVLSSLAACDVFIRDDDTPDAVIIEDQEPDVVIEDTTPDVVIEDHTTN
jgi:hypothetical protein